MLVVCQDAAEQAAFVAQRVLELREEGTGLKQMAVLYRSHFHALELQLELTRRNIPFSITSGIRFFEQAHIKDVTAYLKLVTNPRDELSFKRLAQLLPGIGGKGADKLWKLFYRQVEQAQRAALAQPAVEAASDASVGPQAVALPASRMIGAALQACAAARSPQGRGGLGPVRGHHGAA